MLQLKRAYAKTNEGTDEDAIFTVLEPPPTEPEAHESPALPGATAYVVQLGTDISLVLKAKTTPDCSSVVPRLKESILGRKDASVDHSSLKDLSLDGRPGLEYRRKTFQYDIGTLVLC